jgi:PTS system mannose-specific IIC component
MFTALMVALVGFLAGVESVLDEFQFHRPLLACSLTGLVMGDLGIGILIGGTLEMMTLGWMNIGAAQSPDSAFASILSTILAISAHQSVPVAIALAIPLAGVGQILTVFVRTICVYFQHMADSFGEQGNTSGISLAHIGALCIQGLRVAIPAFFIAYYSDAVVVKDLLQAIPQVITGGLQVAGGFIVVVGYAMVINMMKAGHLMPFFFLGFVVATFLNINLVGIGIMGVVMAMIYLQLKYNQEEC